jgi:transcriptional regulator with XRE-family HTH domain
MMRDLGGATRAAEALGLTPSAVSQIDSEKNDPSVGTAIAVAKATGVTLSALLGES